MSDTKKIITDHDNPEWTDADFAAAKKGGDIPAAIRKAFPQKSQAVSQAIRKNR